MMVMNLASPSKRFEGFRPARCQGKAYTTKTSAANNGGAHRQQSTESGRGRNGKDDDDNGRGSSRRVPRLFFLPPKIPEKIPSAKNKKKSSGSRTDGETNFVDRLHSFSLPSPKPCQQFHSLDKGIGNFSQRYGIMNLGGDAVASAKLGLRAPPLLNRRHRPHRGGGRSSSLRGEDEGAMP